MRRQQQMRSGSGSRSGAGMRGGGRRGGAALLALGVGLSLGCTIGVRIVAPETRSQLPPDGTAAVSIEFSQALGANAVVTVTLVAGVDTASPATADVTSLFAPASGDWTGVANASADVTPAHGIEVGRNLLVVALDPDGTGTKTTRSGVLVSWEPEIDADTAHRCDVVDPRHCLLPFPSSFFLAPDPSADTGLRVNVALESSVRNFLDVPVDPTEWNRNDGFSPGTMILTHIPGVDLTMSGAAQITDLERSLDADQPFAILDAETLERQIFWAELDAHATDPDDQLTILRPGKNLQDGRSYLVALTHVRNASGAPIPAPRGFQIYRDGIPTYIPAVEERRPAVEALFEKLETAGFPREDLYLAWEFTVISTRSMSERLLHMRDDAFGSLAGAAPSFTVTAVADDLNAKILRRVNGTYQVPLYLDNDGKPPARLVFGPDDLPERVGTYEAGFRCIIPRATSADGGDPVTPARLSLYGHGLLGGRGEVEASHVQSMANEHNIVFCATDWIGMAGDDVGSIVVNVLPDFSQFPTIPDRLQQGYLNTMFLGRLMVHPDGFSSHEAFQAGAANTPVLDTSDLFYDGNSQGGIAGGAVAAFAQDWTRASLGVTGMNYSTLMRRSVDFAPFLVLLQQSYPGAVRQTLGVALAQMVWDRADPNGHANHLTQDPYPGTPAKKILMQVALGDFQVANVTAEVEARTIGASIRQPALAPGKHWEDTPYFGIPAIPAYPFDGSALVYWDSGNATPPNENLPPGELSGEEGSCAASRGGDPHECPRRQIAARLQKSEFLKTNGAVVDTCGGAPCLALEDQ